MGGDGGKAKVPTVATPNGGPEGGGASSAGSTGLAGFAMAAVQSPIGAATVVGRQLQWRGVAGRGRAGEESQREERPSKVPGDDERKRLQSG